MTSPLINLKDKSNRYSPDVYLVAADQLDDGGGNGTNLRRQGYLLQVVFDLLTHTVNGNTMLVPFLTGDQSKHTDEFLVQARYRATLIELVICPRTIPKARVYGKLVRKCLVEDGKKEHGKEYIVRRTFELLKKMDEKIAGEETLILDRLEHSIAAVAHTAAIAYVKREV